MLYTRIPTSIKELLILFIAQLDVLVDFRVIVCLLLKREKGGDVDAFEGAFVATGESAVQAFVVVVGEAD